MIRFTHRQPIVISCLLRQSSLGYEGQAQLLVSNFLPSAMDYQLIVSTTREVVL